MSTKPEVERIVVSEAEAAQMIGVSLRTMRHMRCDGNGPPHIRLSQRRIGYVVTILKKWVIAQSVHASAHMGAA